jgi:23S rRNA (guanosine2251-2'-O)-methyltransferase
LWSLGVIIYELFVGTPPFYTNSIYTLIHYLERKWGVYFPRGGTGALVTRDRCARPGPTVSRTSAGASEILPVALETNLSRALAAADEAGLQIVGADLDGVAPWEVDWTRPTVLVIGAEGTGLRRLTREACHAIATIPLVGRTESLNASAAAAALLYEAARQRTIPKVKKNA